MINNRFNVVYHLLYSVFISIFVKNKLLWKEHLIEKKLRKCVNNPI